MRPFSSAAVEQVFEGYPLQIRGKLLALRALIFETAAGISGVGEIKETLKWGEPAYLTTQSKLGSTVRIDWKASTPNQYAMYFNCQTTLIDTFRTLFPSELTFAGNRAIVLDASEEIPRQALAYCIAAALTYHRKKSPDS